MMELVLKHASKPTVHLQWDKESGILQGDPKIIGQIRIVADIAMNEGFISHPIVGINYPVVDPFKDENELALIFAFLSYDCDQTTIPELAEEYSEDVTY
ncbi:hypothetical protein [Acinetobacter tandoii]